jgi:hypothetical protein
MHLPTKKEKMHYVKEIGKWCLGLSLKDAIHNRLHITKSKKKAKA